MPYVVRITARSARERLSGPLLAFGFEEAELLDRVVRPYERGSSITLAGRTLPAGDVSAVEIALIPNEGVRGAPMPQLQAMWKARPRPTSSWLLQHGVGVTDRYITGPPGHREPLPQGPTGHALEPSPQQSELPASKQQSAVRASKQHSEISATKVGMNALALSSAVLSVLLAPAWLAGAVIGCVVAVVLLRRSLLAERPSKLAALAFAGLVATGGVGGYLVDRLRAGPAPISDQLEEVVGVADERGQYPAVRQEVRLHSGASRSFLFVLRDHEARAGGIPREFAAPPSDEVRIYDQIDGELKLALRFQPQNFGDLQQGPDGDAPGFQFRVAQSKDLDGDGSRETLGAFERLTFASAPYPIPLLVWWSRKEGSYRLEPLFDQPPDLRLPAGMPAESLAGYREPTTLRDQLSSTEIRAYPADVVETRQALRGTVVLAAYAESSSSGFTGRYEVKGWFLDLRGPSVQLRECTHARHVYVTPRTLAQVGDAAARALIRSPDRPGCGKA